MPAQTSSAPAPAPLYTWLGGVWCHKKAPMKEVSARMRAQCEVQCNDDSGRRQFGCFPTWQDAYVAMRSLPAWQRTWNELVSHGQRVKPYLDIDGAYADALPEGCRTADEVMARATPLVRRVFAEDYGITLPAAALVWLVSPNPQKLSLHLIVCTHSPQWVYRSNHQNDPQGAVHLARRLMQLDPEGVGKLVDGGVYTKDREMRVLGAHKYGKPRITALRLVGGASPARATAAAFRDTILTWRDDADVREINVPAYIPRTVARSRQRIRTIKQAADAAHPVHQREDPLHLRTFVVGRMLELLQDDLHPTAFHDPSHGREDAYDSQRGVKFNYSDRAEPCYTGCVHSGTQNLRCWVGPSGDVYAKCFSERCQDRPARRLGALHADSDAWRAGAVHVNMRYLAWPPPQDAEAAQAEDLATLDAEVKSWAHQRATKAMCLESCMGTGKTTLQRALLSHAFPGKSALIVTYRQSLALELQRKLGDLGFVNYMDVQGSMHDRDRYPRVICQLDSLARLDELETPQFDLIILDEVESTLCHFASPTLSEPLATMRRLVAIMHQAGHVLPMDANLGAATHGFLERAGITKRTVVNAFRPPPKTYWVVKSEEAWLARIMADLQAGKNVVVASMSTEQLVTVQRLALEAGVVNDAEVLVHTSKSDDAVKRKLVDVDTLWSRYRLVMYSPTIEAGVDMSRAHFDTMHVYCCRLSTTPMGLAQMTGRVRALRDLNVQLCAPGGLAAPSKNRKMTVSEAREFLMWHQASLQRLPSHSTRAKDWDTGREAWLDLPQEDVMFEVTAHNEAARFNSSARFFEELQDLLEAGGHAVRHAEDKPAPEPQIKSVDVADKPQTEQSHAPREAVSKLEGLLKAPDLTEEKWAAVRGRVHAGSATAADKWAHMRHLYKQCWGVDTLDEDFLLHHGTNCQAPEVSQLSCMVYPDAFQPVELTPAHQRMMRRALLLNELMQALGFRSPFDVEHSFKVDLKDVFHDTLRHTELFRDYAMNVRLFSSAAQVQPPAWDGKAVGKVLAMLLGKCGLALKRKQDRTMQRGRKVTSGASVYSLDPWKVQQMSELLWLRAGRAQPLPHSPNAHADNHMRGVRVELYAPYVQLEQQCRQDAEPCTFDARIDYEKMRQSETALEMQRQHDEDELDRCLEELEAAMAKRRKEGGANGSLIT